MNQTDYTQMGMAALLPGMTFMLERMQKELDELRAALLVMQSGGGDKLNIKTKRGRPPKTVRELLGGSEANGKLPSGWPADPEERKAEMARRIAKRGRDMKTAAKKVWDDMSPAKRKQRIAAMTAGRKAKQVPVTKLARPRNGWDALSKKAKADRIAHMNKVRLAKMAERRAAKAA